MCSGVISRPDSVAFFEQNNTNLKQHGVHVFCLAKKHTLDKTLPSWKVANYCSVVNWKTDKWAFYLEVVVITPFLRQLCHSVCSLWSKYWQRWARPRRRHEEKQGVIHATAELIQLLDNQKAWPHLQWEMQLMLEHQGHLRVDCRFEPMSVPMDEYHCMEWVGPGLWHQVEETMEDRWSVCWTAGLFLYLFYFLISSFKMGVFVC